MSPTNNHENQPSYTMHFDSDGASRDCGQDVPGGDGKERMTKAKDQNHDLSATTDTGMVRDEAGKSFQSKKEVLLRELADGEEKEEWYRQAWDNLRRLEKISANLEHSHIADYVALMGKPRKMVILNFMGGLARGFGFGIGFTLLVAVLLYILRFLVGLDLPYIGDFIAQLVQYVEDARTIRP